MNGILLFACGFLVLCFTSWIVKVRRKIFSIAVLNAILGLFILAILSNFIKITPESWLLSGVIGVVSVLFSLFT